MYNNFKLFYCYLQFIILDECNNTVINDEKVVYEALKVKVF